MHCLVSIISLGRFGGWLVWEMFRHISVSPYSNGCAPKLMNSPPYLVLISLGSPRLWLVPLHGSSLLHVYTNGCIFRLRPSGSQSLKLASYLYCTCTWDITKRRNGTRNGTDHGMTTPIFVIVLLYFRY